MKLTTIIILLFSISSISQNCNCEGIINWESEKPIKVLTDPNGSVIKELKNDMENENFLMFKIHESNGEYLKVTINYAFDSEPTIGWIKKEKEVGTYARNYSPNEPLNFYEEPSFNSKVKMQLNEYLPDFYQILDCKDEWALVKLITEEKTYQGWIEPKMQCANPYTTCN
ncbi:SH3 domain-containing protein [Robertkochia sediminum]|uniref:hypothetical protein n=1 Tax=Robertkochia sediminum TaxID=2785326 RepID=UPI001932ED25|nr:hypothetical protein [Robertkochia sediminum]MBL7471223.1 hypothetical protein [Robertkochia sediminum]